MAKNVGVKIEKWGWDFLPESAGTFFFTERQEISTQTKSSKTTLLGGARQGVKKPFKSKKCIFWPENDIFSKKLFYSKLISDQNYFICTCQKIHFQNKIVILQFSPDSTYTCHNCHIACRLSRLIAECISKLTTGLVVDNLVDIKQSRTWENHWMRCGTIYLLFQSSILHELRFKHYTSSG